MKFVDEVQIRVTAGNGGDGCISFRREAYVPKGGPDGGDGGRGGSVIAVGSSRLTTLADFQYHCHYQAGRGQHGRGSNMTGRDGRDIFIRVPLGTDIFDAETGELIGEITTEGQMVTVARGGHGGRGNAAFKTARNTAPRTCEPGAAGEQRKLLLVLRLMSDIGLVGFPNAGKSSLLKQLTNAIPRIAEYPFTTLVPNLGVLETEQQRITVADLPGIIRGAAQGRGLGLRFLRHIERTGLLVFVIDASQPRPFQQYRTLCAEIRAYNPAILAKPQVVCYNKIDLLKAPVMRPSSLQHFVATSALTGEGIEQLRRLLGELQSRTRCTR